MSSEFESYDDDSTTSAISRIDEVDCDSTSSRATKLDCEGETDEVKAVLKQAQKETVRVQLWRFAVTIALLITGTGVTWKTYDFLKLEEYERFEIAVSWWENFEKGFVFVSSNAIPLAIPHTVVQPVREDCR